MRHAASILFGAWLACGVPGSPAAGAHELGHANALPLPAGSLPADLVVDTIGQLPDGRMLFGTSQSVLIYDGRTTETLAFPQTQSALNQVSGTPSGEIVIAATSLMALGRQDAHGAWSLHPLRDPGGWQVAWREPYQVFFSGSDPVVVNADTSGWRHDGNWITWPTLGPEDGRYVRTEGDHLLRIDGGRELIRWKKPDWVPDRTLSENIGNGILWAGLRPHHGLRFIMENGRFLDIDAEGTVHALPTPPGLVPTPLQEANLLPGGGFVTASRDSVVSVLNPSLTQATRIAPDTGLPSGTLKSMFIDRRGDLWTTVSGQVARIEHPAHVTRFDRFNGLDTPTVFALVRHEGRLYAGTSGGIYRLEPGREADEPARFQLLRGPRKSTPALLDHQGGLFAGSTDGVYQLVNDRFELITESPGQVVYLTPSTLESNRIYFGATGGIGRLQRKGQQWTLLDVSPNSTGTRGVVESGPSQWWLLGPQNIDRYDPEKPQPLPVTPEGAEISAFGLGKMVMPLFGQNVTFDNQPALDAWLKGDRQPTLQRWGDTPFIIGARGLHPLDQPDSPLDPLTQAELIQDRRLRVFAPLDAKRAWIALSPSGEAAQNGVGHQLREIQRDAATPLRILPASVAEVGKINSLLPETGSDGAVLWVGGENGLLRIALDGLPGPVAPPAPRVHPTGDLAAQSQEQPLAADYDQLGFAFGTPDFSAHGHVVYRSRIVVEEKGAWTAYSAQPHRDIGHLDPGSYRFEVQARGRDGLVSPTSTFAFSVASPWWFSWWGGLLAVASAAGLIFIGVRWAAQRSRRRERQLEALLAERTATLRANERQLSLAKNHAETAQALAEQANRAKSTFLAAMSHELRTPLNAILGFAQILHREDSLSAKGRAHLDVIGRNGKHLLGMINEVLDLSKIEADKMTLEPAPCSLHRLVSELAQMFQLRASERGLAFRLELAPDVPSRVIADESKLRQVLINLLANAIEHTTAGEVILALRREGPGVRFAVSDTGRGIAAAELEAIFEPFQQTRTHDVIAAATAKGSGLGLPISRRLVGLMKGLIEVESTLGRGSCFHFTLHLPLAPPAADSAPPFRIIGYRGPRRRVLVVDDVDTNRALLQELLSLLGFEIIEAANGEAAVAAQRKHSADLVLLDLHLPDIDGPQVAATLRQSEPRPRLIAISASVYHFDQSSAQRTGCDAFVPKPIEESQLLARIAEQLHLEWLTSATPARDHPWSSEPPPELSTDEILTLPRPPIADLESWLEHARRSDQRRLRAQIAAAPADAPGADFRREIDRLAAKFRTGTIREILAAALQRDPPSPDSPCPLPPPAPRS